MGINKSYSKGLLQRLSEIMNIQCLAQRLAHSRSPLKLSDLLYTDCVCLQMESKVSEGRISCILHNAEALAPRKVSGTYEVLIKDFLTNEMGAITIRFRG